jgi:hypothetical protein
LGTYSGPVSVTYQTSANGNYNMGGFSYNPILNTERYENTTYGLYVQTGFLEIYENGGQATVPGGITTLSTDIWKVEYDGTNVKYYKNSSLIYTSPNPVTQPLHIFFALLTPNEGVTDVCVIGTPDPLPTPTPSVTSSLTPTTTPTPSITPTTFVATQLLTNSDFDLGTTGWSASGGFGTWSFTSSNQVAVLNGVLYFTYVSRTVSQSVNVSSFITSSNSFSGVINIKREENGPNNNDTYNFTLLFKNSSGTTIATKTTGSSIAPLNYTDVTLTLNRSEIPSTFNTITTVEVQLTGLDAGFWNGNHGPWVDYINLNVS